MSILLLTGRSVCPLPDPFSNQSEETALQGFPVQGSLSWLIRSYSISILQTGILSSR